MAREAADPAVGPVAGGEAGLRRTGPCLMLKVAAAVGRDSHSSANGVTAAAGGRPPPHVQAMITRQTSCTSVTRCQIARGLLMSSMQQLMCSQVQQLGCATGLLRRSLGAAFPGQCSFTGESMEAPGCCCGELDASDRGAMVFCMCFLHVMLLSSVGMSAFQSHSDRCACT